MTKDTNGQALIVMGVSGVGKTTVAQALSTRIGGRYIEADEFHPPENVAAMAAGTPLTDAMRQPWLERLAVAMRQARTSQPDTPVVVACSALKCSYRDILRAKNPEAIIIYLEADPDMIRARITARTDHFMPPSLLDSQLSTLEPPAPDEACVTVDASLPPESTVAMAYDGLVKETTQAH
ncbi:gluconokinase [Shimia sagamensis]|uniref:Gluconokinase n=1 Tax=Shimia sagamensis TaxID=1566352 RepID=A0ABY1PBG3_9RHOB|nr:gluconokinase [Shimia sagamensis]SMP30768.1 gluconokinase [Shimia sagamensis]